MNTCTRPWSDLDEAIDGLAELDPDALTDGELHDAIVALQRQRAKLGAVAAALLSRWDHRGVWAGDGSRRAASRLARDTRTSVSSANVELRRARQLRTMPATAAAVVAGELSLDHVDLLGRANRPWRDAVFADHESTLVAECATLRFSQAARLVDYWCQRADAQAADDDAERQREGAHFHARPPSTATSSSVACSTPSAERPSARSWLASSARCVSPTGVTR